MTIGKGKRPRDPNQLAPWTVAVSTGQIPEPPKVTGSALPSTISEYMPQRRSDWRETPTQDHD